MFLDQTLRISSILHSLEAELDLSSIVKGQYPIAHHPDTNKQWKDTKYQLDRVESNHIRND